jgi:hypothetical protein
MLISCVCYVATWEVVYHKFMPDFGEKYLAQSIERVRASGKSPQEDRNRNRENEKHDAAYNSNISSTWPSLSSNHFRLESDVAGLRLHSQKTPAAGTGFTWLARCR